MGYKAFSAVYAIATECVPGIIGRRDLASLKKMALMSAIFLEKDWRPGFDYAAFFFAAGFCFAQ